MFQVSCFMFQELMIAAFTPSFLQKEVIWFEKNLEKIRQISKTNPYWKKNVLFLKDGQKIKLSEVLRRLDELNYQKVQELPNIGEFMVRGGLLTVFPTNLTTPARIEFLGNKIARMETLKEPADQKTREKIIKEAERKKESAHLHNIKPGAFLTHLDHGIGIFKGMSLGSSASKLEQKRYYLIEYAPPREGKDPDRLYVPEDQAKKLSVYLGFETPKIHRLSAESTWTRVKKKVKEDTERLARELLEIYSKREISSRPPYENDLHLQKEFDGLFEHMETDDQKKTIDEIYEDMGKERPMDRLICGDVGFGKTEVAMRAAFLAANSGKQAAVLCPTTILVDQHFSTFSERFAKFPINIAMLSRFESKKSQKETAAKLKEGKIDIVIGTHRLLSRDIEFKNLGLLIIDEEQRFGVKQKEKLKKLREDVDVLSMSATPIPRTLYLAMSGLRHISAINTPPFGRQPIETFVLPYSQDVIKKAIAQELKRGGQIYFLHNRIETIEATKTMLAQLLPEINLVRNSRGVFRSTRELSQVATRATERRGIISNGIKLGTAHGRMGEDRLRKVMQSFKKREIDVLVSTTIIENGLDIKNANTLIVDDAARLGLAQAHQIRGRIGRAEKKSYAYFLHPAKHLSEDAKKRLAALEEANELGSGYLIAQRDLEIRGAGNILGKEQSGAINQVGLNLYCQILAEAVESDLYKSRQN